MTPVEAIPAGVRIHLYVQPRALRTELAGMHDGRLKLRVAAPPVEGEANEAVLRFLAARLGVKRGAVRIASGLTGRRKVVLIKGVGVEEVSQKLAIAASP